MTGAHPEILVVGGGPGGAAAAYWLARAGREVVVVEKKRYPRVKTCGDGLTPRAIYQLQEMGFDFGVPELHRIVGLRAYAGDRMLELPWPQHSVYPDWGAVIRRADLDMQVAALMEKQGAVLRQETEARAVVEGGRLTGVELAHAGEVELVHPRIVVVADGSLSRFGRALGAYRDRDYPYGLAARGYFDSPFSTDGFLESHLDLRDGDGRSVAGYGWLFPLGDGSVNVGVGVLSTFKGWKDLNTTKLLDVLAAQLPDYWQFDPATEIADARGGKLPMAFSVGPKAGPNWLLVGDAAGAVNPFNGEGIDYAYETGRLAAEIVDRALGSGDPGLLQLYPQKLEDRYGHYYRVARAFTRAIGNPTLMRALVRTGLRSRPLMEWVLKVMANLLDTEDAGVAEHTYRAVERVVAAGPEP